VTDDRLRVQPVGRLDVVFRPFAWRFARESRAAIDAHFARLRREKPALWNGQVLLLREPVLADGVFGGSFFATDYASFLAWCDWDFPDPAVHNCFAMGALRAADGAFLLAVMGPHTVNAGRVYFPCGTPDPSDIVGDRVDLDGSVAREVAEETGLQPADYAADTGWHAVWAGPKIALVKVLRCADDAGHLRARIRRHLASQPRPELADVRIVRMEDNADPRLPDFVTAFLRQAWRSAQP
jgi:8-oxo-dGTP pyrophosphatase MutT (NUDIX family)